MYPGTCLRAPLGSTKLSVTILSNTEGIEEEDSGSVATGAVDRHLTMPLCFERIRFEELNRRSIMNFSVTVLCCYFNFYSSTPPPLSKKIRVSNAVRRRWDGGVNLNPLCEK